MGTPAGMSEHPPCFFADDGHTGDCSEGTFERQMSTCSERDCNEPCKPQVMVPKAEFPRAPPGLFSPQRSRRTKGQSLLSTSPKLPSPRRNRKPKVPSAHSVLATGPENLLPSNVLPPSPTRRVRSAILDKAKRDAAPLKVQMESQVQARVMQNLLDPMQPVKKRLPTDSLDGFPELTPGMPAKKRVTPWLLEEPARSMPAMPR